MGGAAIDLGHAVHLAACAVVAALALGGTARELPRALVALAVARVGVELLAAGSLAGGGDGGTLATACAALGTASGAAVLTLVLVAQVALVAAGGERAAEVAARFDLDALPGRQLAIDGDLRAGAVTPEGAAARRDALLAEATARGALDGAFRFVKGDAFAGAAAVAVNLAAATLGALAGRGEALRDAAARGLALAVGQGLAVRLPAALVAGLAAASVLRPKADGDDGAAVRAGLSAGAALCAAVALAPGVRAWPFALVAALALAAARGRRRGDPRAAAIEVTGNVTDVAGAEAAVREALSELGLPFAAAARAGSGPATLRVHGVAVATATAGDPAWARAAAREHGWRALGVDEARAMLDGVAREAPSLLRSLVAAHGLGALAEVLRSLVREGVSLRPLRAVLEALERAGDIRDPALLAERVRVALGPVTLPAGAWLVDPVIASALRDLARPGATPGPALTEDVLRAVRAAVGDDPAPVLVVEQALRRILRGMLARELPAARVVGLDELAEAPRPRGWVRPL